MVVGYFLKLWVADSLDLSGYLSLGSCAVMLHELGLSTALNFLIGLSLFLFSITLDPFLS